jgi:hypothetical protein
MVLIDVRLIILQKFSAQFDYIHNNTSHIIKEYD